MARFRRAALQGATALGLGLALASCSHTVSAISTREAEQKFRREARHERLGLSEIECARSEEGFPRSFVCFAEAANLMHVVARVTIRKDGSVSANIKGSAQHF